MKTCSTAETQRIEISFEDGSVWIFDDESLNMDGIAWAGNGYDTDMNPGQVDGYGMGNIGAMILADSVFAKRSLIF